jgi:UDP-N-acetylmuramoylalanine--D-glutamate ligase
MNFLKDLNVLVLGLGDSGLAMARWCVRHGAQVSVWDSREHPPQAAVLAQDLPGAQRLQALPAALGGEGGFQLVLKSPGLAPADTHIAPLLQEARDAGIAVLGELDLFVHALADLRAARGYAPQVLAITGTNGKTTVTAMTALLVERAGKTVVAAGNIGPTLLDTLARCLDAPVPEPVEGTAEASPAVEPAADATVEPGVEVALDRSVDAAFDRSVDAALDRSVDAAVDRSVDAALDRSVDAALHPGADATADAAADPPAAEAALPALPQVWVLELSSFQLEGGGSGVRGFEPSAAVVLNLTQDHLDWHGSMAAYAAAKARIYGQHAVMVVNRDDAAVVAMVPDTTPVKAKGAPKTKPVPREVVGFGLSAPRQPGDFGLVEENGMAWLVRALPLDDTFKRKKDEELEIHLQRLMPADALRVRGRHNAANALAALALATAIGCTLAPMLHGLREYLGEPHRVQFVAAVNGVEAYDDSKGTNVGATVAALGGLGADKAPARLVVILGGDGKGQDFSPLVAPLAQHARAVATLGRDAALLEAVSEQAGVPVQRFVTLELAVNWAFAQARPGDALLLSPACASLDMFKGYTHRAAVFVAAVQAYAADRGQA